MEHFGIGGFDYAAQRIAKAEPKKRRHNRVGITVTKKLGGAVERNRAKRIIRAGLAEAERLPLKKGFLIVIVARSSVDSAKSTDIASDLRLAFSKLGLVRENDGATRQKKDHGSEKPDAAPEGREK